MTEQDKQILQIKQIYPGKTDIYKPIISGVVHDIYIVKSNNHEFICRFSDTQTANHNLQISELLRQHDISVPEPKIYTRRHDSICCETYQLIKGKTLHERLTEGLHGEKLDNIYHQLFSISYRMSKIPYNQPKNKQLPFIPRCILSVLNMTDSKHPELCHGDLHAKNVILDESDNVRALIDLDAVQNISLRFGLTVIMCDALSYGYDINKLEALANEFNISFGTLGIQRYLKLSTQIRKAYGQFLYIRKQILKIKVK